MIWRRALLIVSIVAGLVAKACPDQQGRTINPSDCVTVRDLQFDEATWRSTIKISPDGTRIAYPVIAPNLKTNRNDVELFVRQFAQDSSDPGKPLLVGDLSAVRWTPDSKHLTMLVRQNDRRELERVDAETGEREVLLQVDSDIEEYSIDDDAHTVVYAIEVSDDNSKTSPTPKERASGYRIPFSASPGTWWPHEKLFRTERTRNGWTEPEPISIRSPLSNELLATLARGNLPDLRPTLSPDGKKLLIVYMDFSPIMPDEWRNSVAMQRRNTAGLVQMFRLLVVYDMMTKQTTVPLTAPLVYSAPLWSTDSQSFVVVTQAPVSSKWEKEDFSRARAGNSLAHLFRVEIGSNRIEEIASELANPWEGPLFWDGSGDLFLRVDTRSAIAHLSPQGHGWREVSRFQLPPNIGRQVTTNGQYAVGDFADMENPPQLFVYNPAHSELHVFANLNPQFAGLTIAHPQQFRWKTSTGFESTGLLLLPPGYAKGARYPLVIQTKSFSPGFNCSVLNLPSFAPEPIANAGIIYLALSPNPVPPTGRFFPKGYPGFQGVNGIAEAAFEMDRWNSAVKQLAAQGLVDPERVGIIGFSRTGWQTEFALAHSEIRYRAATVADNVQYSLGEYWIYRDAGTLKMYDLTYGGPPYGATLKNWLEYSVSFNLDKFHTPLLMEEMGYGMPFSNPRTAPLPFAASFEVFTGLNRLNKPVELYYYPDEGHEPDHPQARLATMQRNVDWYRFWLKEEEDPDPSKVEQYRRWRGLRSLQQADENRNAQGKAGVAGAAPNGKFH